MDLQYENEPIRVTIFDVTTELQKNSQSFWSADLIIGIDYDKKRGLCNIKIHKTRSPLICFNYKTNDRPKCLPLIYYCRFDVHGQLSLDVNNGFVKTLTRWFKDNEILVCNLMPISNTDMESINTKETQVQPDIYNFKTKTIEEIDFARISRENKDAKAIHIKTVEGEFVMVSKSLLAKTENIDINQYIGYTLGNEWGWGGLAYRHNRTIFAHDFTNTDAYCLPYHRIGRVAQWDDINLIQDIIKQVKANERKLNTIVRVLA